MQPEHPLEEKGNEGMTPTTMTPEDVLNQHLDSVMALADRYGFEDHYFDVWGNEHRLSMTTCMALLQTMGVQFPNLAEMNYEAVEHFLREEVQHFDDRHARRWLDPVTVIRQQNLSSSSPAHQTLVVRLPNTITVNQALILRLIDETGMIHEASFEPAALQKQAEHILRNGVAMQIYLMNLPEDLPTGYYDVQILDAATGALPQGAVQATAKLAITPNQCYMPPALQGEYTPGKTNRTWGPAIQLYAFRSARNWGIGDFTDLNNLAQWCADQGAGTFGVNPLHALFPHNPEHKSPYSPSSRLYWNISYLDIESIEDFHESQEAQQQVADPAFQQQLEALRQTDFVDYTGVSQAKRAILRPLYQNFVKNHRHRQTARSQAFDQFIQERGEALENVAIYDAIQFQMYQKDPDCWGWPVWPAEYREPHSLAVRQFAEKYREAVEFFMYCQWQVELQLAKVGAICKKNNMPIGLYTDLAVGVDPSGAEVWANQDLFAMGVSVGAPPDAFNQKGQSWGLPPMQPERLKSLAYKPFIDTVRQNMRFSGALRIDHFLAMMRLFWIPPGKFADEGAYVRNPFDDLLGILALESQRNECVVIGEDLGTVPDIVREKMGDWGILSYKVFFFEKVSDREFKKPEDYPQDALVTVSTHDLPTLSGYWQKRDIDVRDELNLFPTEELRTWMFHDRHETRSGMLEALVQQGVMPSHYSVNPEDYQTMTPDLVQSIYRYMAKTPSRVQVFQLEDVFDQVEQANLPGTVFEHPNWVRKLPVPLEQFIHDTRLQGLTATLREERPLSA